MVCLLILCYVKGPNGLNFIALPLMTFEGTRGVSSVCERPLPLPNPGTSSMGILLQKLNHRAPLGTFLSKTNLHEKVLLMVRKKSKY